MKRALGCLLAALAALAGAVPAVQAAALESSAPGDPLHVDPLAVTDEMRAYVHERVPAGFKPADRLSALMDAIFAKGRRGLGVVYGSHQTRSAVETFAERSGNCISFTHLLVALAREVGLSAYFAEVDEVLTQDLRGETLINNKHMVVEFEMENAVFHVDLVPDAKEYRAVRRISDRRASAHYFNNLGVERLVEDGAHAAMPWFERALELAPELSAAWVNFGVSLRRRGRFDDAERAYRRALELDRSELAALANLAYLYDAWGRGDEADALHRRLHRYRARNPFEAYRRGQAEVAAGDLERAIGHFRDAVRREPEEARFHFALGDALYRSGDLEQAEESLHRAVELAESGADREHFARALEAISMLRSAGVTPVPPTGSPSRTGRAPSP